MLFKLMSTTAIVIAKSFAIAMFTLLLIVKGKMRQQSSSQMQRAIKTNQPYILIFSSPTELDFFLKIFLAWIKAREEKLDWKKEPKLI